MRRIFAMAAFALAFALILPAAQAQQSTPTPRQTPVLPGDFMGMVVRDPHYEWKTNSTYPDGTNIAFYEAMGANLQLAGVKWVRIEFFAEEFDDPGTSADERGLVSFAKYDYFINTVAPKYGFKVIGLLATPLVRYQSGNNQGQYLNPELIEAPLAINGGPVYGYVNQYMQIWLNNAMSVARAFPYNQATGAGVAAFEVLNEENRYLNGGGKGLRPDRVAEMLTKFYRAYKNVQCKNGQIGGNCNEVKILLGGLHPDRCDDCAVGGINDRQYLDAIYKSAAFQSYRNNPEYRRYPVDGIGYHPYPLEMRSGLVPEPTGATELGRVPQRIRDIRAVMVNNGDGANKIWVTEVGDRGAPSDVDNQRRQAQFMQSIYWMLWQQREYVETVLWFKYEDFAVPADPHAVGPENWGVVRLVPRTPTASCPGCEYDPNGSVQVFKESFSTYLNMAKNGIGLQLYRSHLPMLSQGVVP